MWWRNYDNMLSHFYRILENDRQMDGQTELVYQYSTSVCWRAIKSECRIMQFSPLGSPATHLFEKIFIWQFPEQTVSVLSTLVNKWLISHIMDSPHVHNKFACITNCTCCHAFCQLQWIFLLYISAAFWLGFADGICRCQLWCVYEE